MDEADILFFSGGNTYHLMEWVNKSGLKELLPEYLKTKVWVGISAGSMVTNPDLAAQISQAVYDEDYDKIGGSHETARFRYELLSGSRPVHPRWCPGHHLRPLGRLLLLTAREGQTLSRAAFVFTHLFSPRNSSF